MIVYERER